jgi:hypothetical protein
MGFVELQPLAKTPEALATYLDLNLRRLRDAIATLGRVEQTTLSITGFVTIDTGIPIVENVVATLDSAPVAGACFVRAQVDPNNTRQVIVTVYKNDFTQSVTPTNVRVIVVGDEPPNRPTRSS